MALTRDFKETLWERAQQDAAFRRELLRESIDCLLAGDLDVGKAMLRNYVNATLSFKELGKRHGRDKQRQRAVPDFQYPLEDLNL